VVQQVIYRFPSASQFAEAMSQRFAPWRSVFASLAPDGAENLKQELIEEFEKHNRSGNETLMLPMDYLEVVAVKR
jgi:hypothetical protein